MISLRDVITGFGNRDPLAEVWRRDLRGGGGGAAEITGVPPLRYIGDGRPLTDYRISGNTVQDGTPSPDAPVDAAGCGVRTGNLATSVDVTASNNIYIYADKSEMASNTPYSVSFYSDVTFRGNSIYLSTYNPSYSRLIGTISGSGQVSSVLSLTDSDLSAIDNASRFLIRVYKAETDFSKTKNVMLNLGSTALPYEPYGYKLDISSGGENLFDESTIEIGGLSQSTGEETTGEVSRRRSGFIPVLPNTKYTISRPRTGTSSYMWLLSYGDDKSYLGMVGAVCDSNTFVTGMQTYFLRWYTTQSYDYTNVMLNLGSTAKPYSPYNRTTTPIYLGQVETTRRVKKLVLTGEENWDLASSDINRTVCSIRLIGISGNYGYCTHINWKASYASSEYNRIVWNNSAGGTLFVSIANGYLAAQTVADFKSYLAAQYAAGTPVTVWYVLAEPETGIVNEPLMRIGDYADTVSAAQAGVTIPTVNGTNVLDVPTEVKPSEVTIKGGISIV